MCRPISAQFMTGGAVAMFELEQAEAGIRIVSEKHYRLVSPDQLTVTELEKYRSTTLDDEQMHCVAKPARRTTYHGGEDTMGKMRSQPAARVRVVYNEDFSTGPGAWTTGKAVEGGSWHRNIFGDRGEPTPLRWHKSGGRRGPFASTEPPWYFDDNHGEFMWLYLAFFVNRSSLIGLAGADLRNAEITLSLRGHRFQPKGTKLFFWVQGSPNREAPPEKGPLYNWALSSQPIVEELLDGRWHSRTITLTSDEGRWSSMGHLNGGLARKLRVIQSLSVLDGSLDAILDGGHVNFGFLLCGVDPNDPPTGRIDIEQVTIRARASRPR